MDASTTSTPPRAAAASVSASSNRSPASAPGAFSIDPSAAAAASFPSPEPTPDEEYAAALNSADHLYDADGHEDDSPLRHITTPPPHARSPHVAQEEEVDAMDEQLSDEEVEQQVGDEPDQHELSDENSSEEAGGHHHEHAMSEEEYGEDEEYDDFAEENAALDFLGGIEVPPPDAPLVDFLRFAAALRLPNDNNAANPQGIVDQIAEFRRNMIAAELAGDVTLRDQLERAINTLLGEAQQFAQTVRLALQTARRHHPGRNRLPTGPQLLPGQAAELQQIEADLRRQTARMQNFEAQRIAPMLRTLAIPTTSQERVPSDFAASYASSSPALGISQNCSVVHNTARTDISSITFPSFFPPQQTASTPDPTRANLTVEFPKHLVTASQVALHGRDIQGVPWRQLGLQRDAQRERRKAEYATEVAPMPAELRAQMTVTRLPSRDAFPPYVFHQTTQALLPCFHHIQLRHLLHAPTSSHLVYGLCIDGEVRSVDLRLGTEEYAFDEEIEKQFTSGSAVPRPTASPPKHNVEFAYSSYPSSRLALTSLGVRPPLLFMGDLSGLLLVKNTVIGKDIAAVQVTDEKNAIVNAITFVRPTLEQEILADGTLLPCTGTASQQFLVSDNDCFSRTYDLETMRPLREIRKEVPVNYSVASPDGKQVLLCGDAHHSWMHDLSSGEGVATLGGHQDDIFSGSFHPERPLVATASQDHTVRVFDLRRSDKSLYAFGSVMSPMRSVAFGRTGEVLVMAEQADAVHIVDLLTCGGGDAPVKQVIDVFGEISGIALSPDDSSLFIGITDYVYGGLMEWQRAPSNVVDFFD